MTAAVMADLAFAIGSNKVIHLKLKGRLKKGKIEWADNMRQEMGASHPLKNRRERKEFGDCALPFSTCFIQQWKSRLKYV